MVARDGSIKFAILRNLANILAAAYKKCAASVPIKMQEVSYFKFRNADSEKIGKICKKNRPKLEEWVVKNGNLID